MDAAAPAAPDPRKKRCARCRRWFTYRRSTKQHCSDRCRDAAAHTAQRGRDRAARLPTVPLAVQIECAICRRAVRVRVRSGGTPRRYCGRRICRKTAEKIAACATA